MSQSPEASSQRDSAQLEEADGGYKRFHIETVTAPSVFRQPNRFEPKVRKRRLALMLMREFNRYILSDIYRPSSIRKVFTREFYSRLSRGDVRRDLASRKRAWLDRPCIYGVFGSRFGGFKPIKDKCTACMRCKVEHPDVIEDVVWGKEFMLMNHFGLTPQDFYTISYEASEGKELVKGMGYRGPFSGSGWDSIWLDMSEIVRPTRDGKMGREHISTAVDIGRKPRLLDLNNPSPGRWARLELPILFDCANDAWLNQSVRDSVTRAASLCGTMAVMTLKSYQGLPKESRSRVMPLVDGRDSAWLEEDRDAKVVEVAVDAGSPLPSKETFGAGRVVIARTAMGRGTDEVCSDLVKKGFDAIHLVGDPFGGQATTVAKETIRSVHSRLVGEAVRDEVTLIASGGILLAEHVPKAMLCGCDLVGIDVTPYVALQSEFPKVGGHDASIRPREVDPDWGSQRLANLLAAWHEQFIEALSAMGKRDGRRLRGDVGRGIFYEDTVKEAFGDIDVELAGD